jgi:3-deoxy-7-phosphoheptulonate synthase
MYSLFTFLFIMLLVQQQPVGAWHPGSWASRFAYQMPVYSDLLHLEKTTDTLSKKAPLIFAGEADELKHKLAEVSIGKRFLLTGGDCAETFDEFSPTKIREDLQLLMQMSLLCSFAAGVPSLQIGRMAGQFAKPRSSLTETIEGITYPVYRGDIINDVDGKHREPDPERMLHAYHQSAQTLNLLRAFIQGGYTRIDQIQDWKLDRLAGDTAWYGLTMERIREALAFFKTFRTSGDFRLDHFYTGHECLLLPYEESLTRLDTRTQRYYDCSAHFLWLGERTRKLDGAQTEFLRGVNNPIGIKISEQWDPEELHMLLNVLDPNHEPGKITLITRMGANTIAQHLPPLIRAVQEMNRTVVWCCDPMHGNTFTMNGIKTRSYDQIKREIGLFFDIHESLGTIPGGIHLEMTNRNVTECLGGKMDSVGVHDLGNSYESKCDPRLNGLQALELGFMVGEKLKRYKKRC